MLVQTQADCVECQNLKAVPYEHKVRLGSAVEFILFTLIFAVSWEELSEIFFFFFSG